MIVLKYKNKIILELNIGDKAGLIGHVDQLRTSFETIPYGYNSKMIGMFGQIFEVLDVKAGLVALPSPDGSDGGKWWFSTEVVVKGQYIFTLHIAWKYILYKKSSEYLRSEDDILNI